MRNACVERPEELCLIQSADKAKPQEERLVLEC